VASANGLIASANMYYSNQIINGYITGTYTSDANATASQILSGKTAYVNGSKITGTMTNKSGTTTVASTVTQSGTNALITMPAAGYYDTSSKISVPMSKIASGFTKQSKSVTFTASVNYATVTATFSFPTGALGVTSLGFDGTSMNSGGDSNSVAVWVDYGFGISGNKVTIPLRGLTAGTSYTLKITAIGY